jgi:hypothetical protein
MKSLQALSQNSGDEIDWLPQEQTRIMIMHLKKETYSLKVR